VYLRSGSILKRQVQIEQHHSVSLSFINSGVFAGSGCSALAISSTPVTVYAAFFPCRCAAFHLAHLALCAAAILFRAERDIRCGMWEAPPLRPAERPIEPSADSAESRRSHSRWATALAFFNCRITADRVVMPGMIPKASVNQLITSTRILEVARGT
jgi:hypothetical protein